MQHSTRNMLLYLKNTKAVQFIFCKRNVLSVAISNVLCTLFSWLLLDYHELNLVYTSQSEILHPDKDFFCL